MYHKYSELFKELVRIEVVKRFPRSSRGRPVSLTFQDAWDSIILILRTGMQWRSLVPKTASYITVFKTMHLWMKSNVFKTAYTNLLRLYRRQRRTKYYCVDSTHVKNVYGRDCKGRNHADRGRFSTKLSAVVDDKGIPFAFHVAPGNASDMKLLLPSLQAFLIPADEGIEVFADKGYDSKFNRNVCRDMGFKERILKRKCKQSRRTHARRIVVEHFFSWHDKCRRLILRYEQKIETYLEFTFLSAGLLLGQRISFV